MAKIQVLGLTLFVVVALAAAVPAGASAEGRYTFDSTSIEGSQTETAEFEGAFGVVKCPKTTFTSTVSGTEATSLTITPAYSECKLGASNATIDVNGCKYALKAPTETGQSPPADMHAETTISKCTKAIEITAGLCTIKIAEQTPKTPTFDLSNKNTAPFKTLISPTFKGVSYSYSGFGCGSGSGENGVYRGAVEVQGVIGLDASWLEAKRIAGTAKEGALGICEFAALGQNCEVEVTNKTTRTLRVLGVAIEGFNGNVRYKRTTEGCVFLAAVPCNDVIEAIKFEAKTHNDYCVRVEDIGIGVPSRACFGLQM